MIKPPPSDLSATKLEPGNSQTFVLVAGLLISTEN